MFKVLIIDDEALIARGLETKIDWEKMSCRVCGVANNGTDGKRLIDEMKPDIIVSDIVMPGMDGLELAEYSHLYYPDIVIIILTAYDKFQYAQKAIKYGVKDYILKPIDKNEIVRAVRTAVVKLRRKELSIRNISKLETMVEAAKPLITNTILFDIALNGNDEIDHIKNKLQYFDINIGKGAIIVIQIENADRKHQSINKLHCFTVRNAIQDIFNRYQYSCTIKELEKYYIVLAKFEEVITDSVIKKRLMELCREIHVTIDESIKLRVDIGIGSCFHNIYELHRSYEEAIRAINETFFRNTNAIIHADEVSQKLSKNYYFSNHEELYSKIKNKNRNEAMLALEKIILDISEIQDVQLIKGVCINIIEQLNQSVMEVWGDDVQKCSVEIVRNACSFSELADYLKESVKWYFDISDKIIECTSNSTINKALEIIHKKYYDKKLSLQSVAAELDISFSYLSRLFKQEMNINFMDYLTDLRINKAKKMLAEGELKNNEIADRVGFYDSRYFSQVFRKKCETTPSKYKKRAVISKN